MSQQSSYNTDWVTVKWVRVTRKKRRQSWKAHTGEISTVAHMKTGAALALSLVPSPPQFKIEKNE